MPSEGVSQVAGVALIWAADRRGAIGRAGEIPWRIPEDQRRFRTLTRGHPVIMGRKTWDSLPSRFRPLPDRRNLVVTRDPAWSDDGAEAFTDLAAAVAAAGEGRLTIMGGGQIYAAAMDIADVLYVTEVDVQVDDADAFAPAVDPDVWQVAEQSEWLTSTTGTRYRFVDHRRITVGAARHTDRP